MARSFWIRTNRSTEITAAITDVERFNHSVQENIKSCIAESTQAVKEGARRRVHVQSGKLKNSILARISPSGYAGFVSANTRYAHIVEFGAGPAFIKPKKAKALYFKGHFAKYSLVPERKARPFLRPAADEEKVKLEHKMREAIERWGVSGRVSRSWRYRKRW